LQLNSPSVLPLALLLVLLPESLLELLLESKWLSESFAP